MSLFRAKPRRRAAIHHQCLTGHEGGLLVVHEEVDGVGDLFGIVRPTVNRRAIHTKSAKADSGQPPAAAS